jgi:hypothetical protein
MRQTRQFVLQSANVVLNVFIGSILWAYTKFLEWAIPFVEHWLYLYKPK